MAYNNYQPNYYYPNYPYSGYMQPVQQPIQQAVQQPVQTQQTQAVQPQQIQNGGFVSVRNENEARNYPVALGNSVTFIDETAPYCYTKTMGFSQLDRPKFEKYRLVKEVEPTEKVEKTEPVKEHSFATKSEIEALQGEIEKLKNKIEKLQKEREAVNNDEHKRDDVADASIQD